MNSTMGKLFSKGKWPGVALLAMICLAATLLGGIEIVSNEQLSFCGGGSRLDGKTLDSEIGKMILRAPLDLVFPPHTSVPLSFPEVDNNVKRGHLRLLSVVNRLAPAGLRIDGRKLWHGTENGKLEVAVKNIGENTVTVRHGEPLLVAYDVVLAI